uniref:Protein tyrosine phosphatase receptor type H n=1 Tax=Rousettus aegyptiacus TaxID=9407 RepID=A0A7J8CKU9_ROUAE|nr:protein tyrosine phosphatase receptor type H [Rousettus aegyptiacus]
MTGSGGDLRTWRSLVLLGLCSWTVARAAGECPVLNFTALNVHELLAGAGGEVSTEGTVIQDPNPIRNLNVEAETTSSVTLCWEAPEGPDLQNCTYWVQWIGDGNKTETQSTTNTSVTMEGLELGTLYKFSVWAEENGVPGSRQNLSISTDTGIMLRELEVESQYTFTIWAERNGASSDNRTLTGATGAMQCDWDGVGA